MISHFAINNQLTLNHIFTKSKPSTNLLAIWKKIHKRKRKKKAFFYLSKLKKQKKLLYFKKETFKYKPKVKPLKALDSSLNFTAHIGLFSATKKSSFVEPKFYKRKSLQSWKSIKHLGHTIHGDIIWIPNKKHNKNLI